MEYAENDQKTVISNGWQALFINSDEGNCPMTKCYLKDAECKQEFTENGVSIHDIGKIEMS